MSTAASSSDNMKSFAIAALILAGGKGKRAGDYKQFKIVAGKPLLLHSMEAFVKSGIISEIVLMVPKEKMRLASAILRKRFRPAVHIIRGGKTRRSSTYRGLTHLGKMRRLGTVIDYVIVHDAARPLITALNIRLVAKEMLKWGSAVTGMPSNGIPTRVKRGFVMDVYNKKISGLYDGTTPQCFRFEELLRAHKRANRMKDLDGSADNLEILKAAQSKLKVKMVPLYPNLKVTYPSDVRAVSSILRERR